jgi:phosphoribosylformylglycinamidine synthase
METDAIVAIQDMGAAGLTSSSFEMADKGGLGIEIALDQVPMRETGMNPYELMLSESQERMLMVLKPGREDEARRIFEKWELDFAIIGRLTDTRRMVLRWHGDVVASIPIPPVVSEAPMYERPWTATPLPAAIADVPPPADHAAALLTLLGSPDQCSKAWIWHQYDHLIMGNTAIRPGGDAAVVRVPGGGGKALAVTSDCTPRYCQAHPETGGRQAVAEAWRNLTATGATPLACTDNMNFGNPQKPEIMGQFAGCVMGMAEACTALAFPIVSGNVSLYNETQGRGILPTPVIGGVGVMKDVAGCVDIAIREAGLVLVLVGETRGHLGHSIYLRDIHGREDGPPPPVDLAVEKRNGDFVRAQIQAGHVAACHDLSDGGLALALAEMAMAGGVGATVALPADAGCPAHAWLFGEDQGRYVIAVRPAVIDPVLSAASRAGVPAMRLGVCGGGALTVEGLLSISITDLRRSHEDWLPAYMEARH